MTTTRAAPHPDNAASAGPLTLTIGRFDDLFRAPASNPFAAYEVEVLGESGIEYLQKRFKRRWPRRYAIRELVVQLPATEYDAACGGRGRAEWSRQAQAAVQRYCAAHIETNAEARRLAMATARQQLWIALLVTGVAVGMLALVLSGRLTQVAEYMQGILTILAVFAASLAIWDALESLFFDWVPFAAENRTYRWIGELDLRIVPLLQAEDSALPSGPLPKQ